jgi:hypothetical protein
MNREPKELILGTILGDDQDIQTIATETQTVTKDMLEKENLVDFSNQEGAKLIEIIRSPIQFIQLGSEILDDLFEVYLDPNVNVDLAFNGEIKDFVNSYWTKNYNRILKLLGVTRLLPLLLQNMLLLYPDNKLIMIFNLMNSAALFS